MRSSKAASRLAVLALSASMAAFGQSKPNILLIFTDDHASAAIGAYGGRLKDVVKTPNIDRLAKEGMRFERAYVTNALCGPSRAVVQTGKYSHKNGFRLNGDRFDGTQPTMPKMLKAQGYQTAVIGKWHLVSDPQGYDYWDVVPDQGAYYNPDFIRGDATGRKETRKITGFNSGVVADLALDWMQNGRDKSKPFLLMYQFKAPHRNWQPGSDHVGMYKGVKIPEPANLVDDYRWRGSATHFQDMSIRNTMTQDDLKLTDPGSFASWTADQRTKWTAYYSTVKQDFAAKGFTFTNRTDNAMLRWKYQRYMEDYLSVVAEMDKGVGRMLDYLDQNGLAQNTVVVYSSDQGFFLGEHGWFDKRFMFEESLKTPLIVRWPGQVRAGSVNATDLVSNLDFAETFLELAGVPVPADMQGASMVPVLKGQTPATWRKTHYYQYYEGPPAEHKVYRHYGVTTGRYKLIYFHDVDEWEFFDLQKDPSEMINQYYIPENAAKIAELKAELARLRQKLEVPADPPKDGTLRTVTLEKWTTPLPDNPVSAEERAAAQSPEVEISFDRGAGKVSFRSAQPASGRVAVSIHRVNGSLLETLGGSDRFEWDVSTVRPGVYIVEWRQDADVRFLKFRI